MLTKRLTLGLVAAAALVAGAPAAQAATPTPCGGAPLLTDPAGDQQYKVQGNGTGMASPSNTDGVGLFFRNYGDNVTANLVVDDLTLTLPDGFSAVRYRAYWFFEEVEYYVQALVTADGVEYSYGEPLPALTFTKLGDTTGAIFEGKNGVVQIVLPKDRGGVPGTKLGTPTATIGLLTMNSPEEAHTQVVYWSVDNLPDADAGPDTTPVSCDAPATTGGPTNNTNTPPPTTNTPPPTTTTPSPATSTSTTPALKLTLSSAKVSAKKANKNKAFAVKLQSSQNTTQLAVKLKKGSKVVASAKVAKLSGSATIKLKTLGKLKKGKHMLTVTGKKADGSAFSVSFKVVVSG